MTANSDLFWSNQEFIDWPDTTKLKPSYHQTGNTNQRLHQLLSLKWNIVKRILRTWGIKFFHKNFKRKFSGFLIHFQCEHFIDFRKESKLTFFGLINFPDSQKKRKLHVCKSSWIYIFYFVENVKLVHSTKNKKYENQVKNFQKILHNLLNRINQTANEGKFLFHINIYIISPCFLKTIA